jgi:hypothetical protein
MAHKSRKSSWFVGGIPIQQKVHNLGGHESPIHEEDDDDGDDDDTAVLAGTSFMVVPENSFGFVPMEGEEPNLERALESTLFLVKCKENTFDAIFELE